MWGSAVIHLESYQNPPVSVKDEKLMFALIRASFNQRRKTLLNGLKNASIFPLERRIDGDFLQSLDGRETVRSFDS